MQRFILIRLLHSLLVLWVVSVLVFSLTRATGNPADALQHYECTEECRRALEEYWGLNKPLVQQYLIYIGDMFQGNFGESFRYRPTRTIELLKDRFPVTAQLAGVALTFSLVLAVPIGVLSAVRKDTPFDFIGKIIALLGQSLPTFWVGIVLIWIFAVNLGWLPPSGKGGLLHLVLPAITLGWWQVAAIMRLMRSSMLEVIDSEYIKMARIKGISEWKVLWKHALRNAAIPPLTFFGMIGAAVLSGALITETVFAWPGVGSLALEAVLGRDYAVVQTLILIFATIYVLSNLIVDILYAYLDPRIRYS